MSETDKSKNSIKNVVIAAAAVLLLALVLRWVPPLPVLRFDKIADGAAVAVAGVAVLVCLPGTGTLWEKIRNCRNGEYISASVLGGLISLLLAIGSAVNDTTREWPASALRFRIVKAPLDYKTEVRRESLLNTGEWLSFLRFTVEQGTNIVLVGLFVPPIAIWLLKNQNHERRPKLYKRRSSP